MKKMHIILLVVTVIVVLAVISLLTTEVLALDLLDTSRVVDNMKGLSGLPDVENRIQRAIVIGVVVGAVTLFVIFLVEIAKQQKKPLENQKKDSKAPLVKPL
ncbi:hypothetical protein KKE19_00855 [Patescibacteria group bacterium]|nr:hypothetical protein [Patescibacteria group bacterium]MBU4274343.1 hypothetical protein [Patescibacteria group bacterium]MBU4367549.1 hypothetical protein [Patescibacteria group bacterium]MBU4461590.1 hypothetical protein [Patescibacteria group bacterium]MCG2699487.1 hypothetical protein [Candidatus Parcubacteria bacterium]